MHLRPRRKWSEMKRIHLQELGIRVNSLATCYDPHTCLTVVSLGHAARPSRTGGKRKSEKKLDLPFLEPLSTNEKKKNPNYGRTRPSLISGQRCTVL
ncbi:hypothetical protein TNIN_123311 [Trichonephila inaurata madagascariensis]|uniref:Uncharacterized protein n=1 Tax=Trichonephila inaurata madagascariensis TaxID=2747483 RepID=A0A8X6IXV6_9ARAC|nr:hypothetical protein TNIN_123311 [Trichonephila inaurata madagascariensis]